MVQYEIDPVTAGRALANLIPLGATASVCPTKNGTTVIAVDDAHADKLRELIGVEEPKKFRVFLALASIRESMFTGLPIVESFIVRNYQTAVIETYGRLAATCQYSDKGWLRPNEGGDDDVFKAICREFFIHVSHIDRDKETTVFRSDPLAGRTLDPELVRVAKEHRLRGGSVPGQPASDNGSELWAIGGSDVLGTDIGKHWELCRHVSQRPAPESVGGVPADVKPVI